MAKIAIDARMIGARTTGIGLYIEELLSHLFQIDRENEYAIFLLPEAKKNFLPVRDGITPVEAHSHWYSWSEQLALPWKMRRSKPALIHFPHFNAPIVPIAKYSVVTIHDLTPKYFPGHKMKSPVRRLGFSAVMYTTLSFTDRIIAVSGHTKNEILRHQPDVPASKIVVIREGPGRSFREEKISPGEWKIVRKRFGIEKPYIFYAGVWRNHKNLAGLLKAFFALRKDYKIDCQLVLGGEEDPHYPEVRRMWESLGLSGDVIRTGFVGNDDLAWLYRHAEVFALPSFSEGFGFVGLEAMRMEVPVVASAIPALKEVYGRAAEYCDPHKPEDIASALHRVLTKQALRRALVEKGSERWRKFSWQKMAQETLRLYREILQ